MNLPGVDLIEQGHHDEGVEHDGEVLRRWREQRSVKPRSNAKYAITCKGQFVLMPVKSIRRYLSLLSDMCKKKLKIQLSCSLNFEVVWIRSIKFPCYLAFILFYFLFYVLWRC